ncbi:hypothetical protein PENTCL1PPCAC_27669, partial [Pristionchus entomophagus]
STMLSRQAVRSAHAAARSAAPATKAPEQSTKLPSGLTVASVENNGPVAHLVLAFRAGSRYENGQQAGLVHHIRNMVGSDSKQYGGVQLVWSAAAAGSEIHSFSTPDYLGVRLSVPRDSSTLALSVLGHIAADPAFKEWELEDVLPTLKHDLTYLRTSDLVFEDIRRAAFRNGSLSHPLYASDFTIGKYSGDELRRFASSRLVAGQAVLYGANIEHERLRGYGDVHAPLKAESGSSAAASPYKGGEWRREGPGSLAHVVIAGQGAAAGDAAGLAAQAVLVASLGAGNALKFGAPAAGRGTLAGFSKQGDVGVSAFEQTFEGEGLVGAYVLASSSRVAEAVKGVARALKTFAADDLEAAKKRAKMDILRKAAHSADAATSRSMEILAGLKEGAVLAAIDNVTGSQVESAAKKASSNLSIASYGAIANVPYRDQL